MSEVRIKTNHTVTVNTLVIHSLYAFYSIFLAFYQHIYIYTWVWRVFEVNLPQPS